MLDDKDLRPSWMQKASEEDQRKQIENLTAEDIFRSQFRTEAQAPRSDVAIIEWGLTHIERLRKAKSEASAATATSRQVRLVFFASILGIAATIIAAIIGGVLKR